MNGYKINYMNHAISITADFARKMNDPSTKEYKTITKILKDFPSLEIVHRSHARPTRYRNNDGSITARNQFKNIINMILTI